MPQLYCQLSSRPNPWLLGHTSAGLCTLQTACPLTITYSGGSPAPDTIAAATGATVYGGSAATFDASLDVWVVLTVAGSGALQATKEAELAAVGGDWAGLARIVQHTVEPYQPQAYLSAGGLGAGGAPSTVTVASTVGQGKAHDLGVGGSPPAGWETTGFNDSAWTAPVAETTGTIGSPIGSTAWVTWADGTRANLDHWLLRHGFVLPAGTVTAATVQIWADDFTEAVYVNGVALSTTEVAGGLGVATYTVSPGTLVVGGGANVLAVHVKNGTFAPPNPSALDYLLSVTVAASVGGAAEGSLLYFNSGAWANLPIGTSGQELTVVGGDPAWATPAAGYSDPLTTKGDLLTRSSSATVRLGVGSNGQVVTADSTAADGIKWATPPSGSVTSIDVAVPAPLSSAGGPITSGGTITLSWAGGQTANRVLATPNGTTGAVSVRALVGNDIPVDASTIISSAGTIKGNYQAGSGVSISGNTISATGSGGSVTSVALTMPSSVFSTAGSPITTNGTLVVSLATQSPHTFWAGPAAGSAAAPTFRALQGSDLPKATGAGGKIHAHGHLT